MQYLVYQERLIAFDKENKHTSYISGKEIYYAYVLMPGVIPLTMSMSLILLHIDTIIDIWLY